MALTTTRYFRWDDPGAPVLNGTAGSLIELLKACLVGGVGGVAYGSGADQKMAAGWTEEFTATNKAAFRNSRAAGGTGCYLRVDDNGAGVGGTREARCRTYSDMTDLDVGEDPTPTLAQAGAGVIVRKSQDVSSTIRRWFIAADERTVHCSIHTGSEEKLVTFGDYNPARATMAPVAFLAGGSTAESSGVNSTNGFGILLVTAQAELYVCRGRSLALGAVQTNMKPLGESWIGGPGAASPPPDAHYTFTPAVIRDSSSDVIGVARGLLLPTAQMAAVAQGQVLQEAPGALRLVLFSTQDRGASSRAAVAVLLDTSW